MKKSLIFKILYLFLILIVVASASVFATNTYLASQVSYASTNVEDALNDLYTLKGNDENYSTDEKIIGKWIDGKPIYRNIIDMGNQTTKNTSISKDISFLNIDKPLKNTGYALYNNNNKIYNFPIINGEEQVAGFAFNSDTLSFTASTWMNNFSNIIAIIEYTKKSN